MLLRFADKSRPHVVFVMERENGQDFIFGTAKQDFDLGVAFVQVNRQNNGGKVAGPGRAGPRVNPATFAGGAPIEIAVVQWIDDVRELGMARAFRAVNDDAAPGDQAFEVLPLVVRIHFSKARIHM